MDFNKQLEVVLTTHFSGLKLKSPLFYNSSYAIRFELGGTLDDVRGREEQVKKRAVTLFNALNRNEHDIYVILFIDRWDEHPISSFENEVFQVFKKYVSGIRNNHISKREQDYRYKDPDENDETVTIRYCVKVKVKELDEDGLFGALAKRGMGNQATIIGDIYFLNATNNTIFHIYDDRGLDIVAENKETLDKIYKQYNNWILDYDRIKIDDIFS